MINTLSTLDQPFFSKEGQTMFQAFKDGYLENTEMPINFAGLDSETIEGSNIAPIVSVDLMREKDSKNVNRLSLSNEVSRLLHSQLKSEFSGHADTADYILDVRILVASEGSIAARLFGGRLGSGWAKLSVGYCLISRYTGEVIVAKHLCYGDNGLENDGKSLVRNLARHVGSMAMDEVSAALSYKTRSESFRTTKKTQLQRRPTW